MSALFVPLDVVSDDCSLERVRRCPTNARVHYFFAAPKRTRKMCRKGIGRPMPQQSGALCSTVGTQCQRVRLSARAALTAYVRSEHAPAVVRKRLSTYLCYRSAFCDGLAARWRLVCTLPSPATRRACDEPRSVCTKCVCLYVHSVQVYRSCGVPVLLTRSNRMNNTS